jgi:hypothetical protein
MERCRRVRDEVVVCDYSCLARKRNVLTITAHTLSYRVIRLAILRLSAIHDELLSPNSSPDGISIACLTRTELAYSIAASTTPSLTPLMMSLKTNMGTMNSNLLTSVSCSSHAENTEEWDSDELHSRQDGPTGTLLVSKYLLRPYKQKSVRKEG